VRTPDAGLDDWTTARNGGEAHECERGIGVMLDTFIAENREEIIRRCRVKVELRSIPQLMPGEAEAGVTHFLDQLVDTLRHQPSSSFEIGQSAAQHGRDLLLQGFTVSQVVHSYGDVCQSITDLALHLDVPIGVEDFRTLNRCLDDAIASAVTEYGRGNQFLLDAETARGDERVGLLAHEIRNLVGTASVAFEVLRTGNVGVGGSTGNVLQRTLASLRDVVNRSVSDVRLRHEIRERTQFSIAEFLTELAPAAALDAGARGLSFTADPGDAAASVAADRPVLAAVVANLLQNAFKYTRPGTTVTLRGSATADRVLIEVEDECGGLPEGDVEGLFQPFEQRSADRTGLGLGLAMSRWGTEINDGRLSARNRPEHGCVFTVDLPRLPVLAER
jgi:signal transduction histidine kinase